MKYFTFGEEYMSVFVHGFPRTGEVSDECGDGLFTGSDQINGIHCGQRLAVLVQVFHN